VVERFTGEQLQVLAHLEYNRRALVAGCTGSGKTFLALETALRLDREGQRVLILCHNPHLAENLQARAQGSAILIADFNTFVHNLLKEPALPELSSIPSLGRARGVRPKYERGWSQYDEPVDYELNLALSRMAVSKKCFDAVFVDESQDFKLAWWELIEACLEDHQIGRLVIFYDDNQAIYPFSMNPEAHLGAQLYASLAPIVLSQNCRNGGEIFTLVQQLHPETSMEQAKDGVEGVVKEWIYSNESELVAQVRAAIAAAETVSNGLKDFIILSAENVPVQQSKLNGMICDAPGSTAKASSGRVDWQSALRHYLHRFGFVDELLSKQILPTKDDVRIVNQFCDGYLIQHHLELSRQNSYLPKHELGWSMDYYGALHLHWKHDANLEVPGKDLLYFFRSPGWTRTLPPASKRYRISPLEDYAANPDYENIRLVDIPAFKGLESEGVIFIFYNYFAEDQLKLLASLYMGFSRASKWLYIVTPYSLVG
jgi:hypothetical protein